MRASETEAKAPETEGELYDRLKGLEAECRLLAESVGPLVQVSLEQAADKVRESLRLWLLEL